MKRIINKLPDRFKWTIHNVVAHPLSEVLFQLGFEKASNKVHDCTTPDEKEN